MAEVQYKSEPTVSVHGVPQSQYNAQPGAPGAGTMGGGGGGIAQHFKQHWIAYSLGIGAAGLVIMFLIYRQNSAASTAATVTGNSASGSTTPPATIDSSWGSQLDADYQQLTSVETTNTGLLQSILNGITGANSANPTNPSNTQVISPVSPLLGTAKLPGAHMGDLFNFEGIVYQENPGPTGVWGVPEVNGKQLTIQQIQQTPIGSGPGQKRLLARK